MLEKLSGGMSSLEDICLSRFESFCREDRPGFSLASMKSGEVRSWLSAYELKDGAVSAHAVVRGLAQSGHPASAEASSWAKGRTAFYEDDLLDTFGSSSYGAVHDGFTLFDADGALLRFRGVAVPDSGKDGGSLLDFAFEDVQSPSRGDVVVPLRGLGERFPNGVVDFYSAVRHSRLASMEDFVNTLYYPRDADGRKVSGTLPFSSGGISPRVSTRRNLDGEEVCGLSFVRSDGGEVPRDGVRLAVIDALEVKMKDYSFALMGDMMEKLEARSGRPDLKKPVRYMLRSGAWSVSVPVVGVESRDGGYFLKLAEPVDGKDRVSFVRSFRPRDYPSLDGLLKEIDRGNGVPAREDASLKSNDRKKGISL